MSEEEHKEPEVEHEEGGTLPDLDDAFEESIDTGLDEDLGPLTAVDEEEEDLDTDLLGDDRDGNY